jgi:hypothetical protein
MVKVAEEGYAIIPDIVGTVLTPPVKFKGYISNLS